MLLAEPGYEEAARRLSAEIATMPAPADVVADLERLGTRGTFDMT